MCSVKTRFVVFVAQLSLICGPLALAEDETKPLTGEWRVVALQSGGKQDSGVSFSGMIWKFDQSEYVLIGDRKLLGIYCIKDGRLYVCLARFGSDRPTSFETKGTENLCYVLERINAGVDKDEVDKDMPNPTEQPE